MNSRQSSRDNDMVKALRHRFVRTAMISLLLILVLLVGVINVANFVQIDREADGMLHILQDNDGAFPLMNMDSSTQLPVPPSGEGELSSGSPPSFLDLDTAHRLEAPYETRYYWVKLDDTGQVTDTDTSHIAAVSQEQAKEQAVSVYKSGDTSGYIYTYKYLLQKKEDATTLIVFVDCSSSVANAIELLRYSLLIGAAALVLMLLLVWLFSGKAVAPVVESLEKQKRFVSDAGHELKTPISVISANVDVLEMTGTKNKWTDSIRHQVRRMTDLVNNLLTLSRMEESTFRQMFCDVDFSEMVQDAVDTYETVAQAKKKKLTYSIAPDIHLQGEPKSLQQLCTLLLDNAVKYSDPEGTIHLELREEDNRKSIAKGASKNASKNVPKNAKNAARRGGLSFVILEVANTSDQIPDGDLDKLFDRFYRADSSRSHKKNDAGGFGIGLSVARAICDSHKGSIQAFRDGDRIIRFRVRLPETNM